MLLTFIFHFAFYPSGNDNSVEEECKMENGSEKCNCHFNSQDPILFRARNVLPAKG
jgi:hypothetical protein